MNLILASASKRRKEILKKNGFKFKVVVGGVEEKTKYKRPCWIVKDLALKKARYVAEKYPDDIILAADTIVYCCKKVIGKPRNHHQAFELLKLQSGKWQKVYTGVALVIKNKNIELVDFEKSSCYMKKMDEKTLKKISKRHLDKAGGWAVQEKKDRLITKIKGRYDNIVGLPMNKVKKLLKMVKYM